MATFHKTWLPMLSLEDAFADEFGVILPEVYKAACELWNHSESFVLSTLGAPATGQRLMFKAAALVSRRLSKYPDQIKHLHAYLRQTFKGLALDEMEKENGHRDKIERAQGEPSAEYLFGYREEDLDRKILIQQIIRLMDDWTREVFVLLAADYSYEKIAAMRGQSANAIRSRFSKQLKKIRKQIQS